MSLSANDSPTDIVPPPSYQLSQEDFDQKTLHAIQLSSSTAYPIIDGDGWPIYNAAAFEAVAESFEHYPPGSSSAGLIGADASRYERQTRSSYVKLAPSTHPMKTRSSERRRRNAQPDRELFSEPRIVTPPPPFTATGPSLDGPPFEEVVLSYHVQDSQAASLLEPPHPPPPQPRSLPVSRTTQPVALVHPPSQRFSDPQAQASSNPYPSRRIIPVQSDASPRPNPVSTITRVEFDPQMAYSPYGGIGHHTSIQGGPSAFYNHAVASQLTTNPTITSSTQPGHPDNVSSPYSSVYSPTTYRTQLATPSVSHSTPEERYTPHPHSFRFSTPVPPPPLAQQRSSTSLSSTGYAQPASGTGRGPLPPVPSSNVPLSHPRWTGSDPQLV
ncbi:hypothetical protein B0F90DRAFT_1684050 [Multifurca ochricompacta]|uniref:Uncharacterized protein n=1 Tax=Multifurca ochricompacta TaxID=376703 RepID=A0AAD4MBT5_9AGAM|nr:hypothetical protein B0F90DRAFT_1684050 [Multifurca ochricompacta]